MAQEDDLELDTGQSQASKKKLIIIMAAVLLLLLIGGGVAAWLLLGGDEEEADAGQAATQEEQVAVAEKGPVAYHDMKPVFVVSLPGTKRLLQVGLQVRVYYPELVPFLEHNDPALRHAILNLLGTQDAETLATLEGKEALREAIREKLNELIKKYRGPGEVDAVLYSGFVTQ